MTAAALNSPRLTDAVERDLLNRALESQNTLRPLAAVKAGGLAVIAFVRGIYQFAVDVSNAMDEARERSARFTGAQW